MGGLNLGLIFTAKALSLESSVYLEQHVCVSLCLYTSVICLSTSHAHAFKNTKTMAHSKFRILLTVFQSVRRSHICLLTSTRFHLLMVLLILHTKQSSGFTESSMCSNPSLQACDVSMHMHTCMQKHKVSVCLCLSLFYPSVICLSTSHAHAFAHSRTHAMDARIACIHAVHEKMRSLSLSLSLVISFGLSFV